MTVRWHGNAIQAMVEKAAMDGIEEWARVDVLTKADQDCPVDEGTMRASHTVERKGDRVTVGYGGPAAPYTLVQHEDVSLNHPGQGKAKWLEDAFKEKLPSLETKVNRRIKGIL